MCVCVCGAICFSPTIYERCADVHRYECATTALWCDLAAMAKAEYTAHIFRAFVTSIYMGGGKFDLFEGVACE